MSKSANMLRTRRRDNNVKPNRRDTRISRLDRKSSRGMIYENEELRLRTININAEIERGQYDIKKLKRENEMLKKEIWCLRDEYEKLDKLLKEKEYDFSSSTSTTCSDSESCSSCSSEESEQVETSQNLENVQKTTTMKNLHKEFDHLSVVPEENSTENSDKASLQLNDQWDNNDIIKPDQSYPLYNNNNNKANTLPPITQQPKHFFSPIKMCQSYDDIPTTQTINEEKSATDLIVKSDNYPFCCHNNNDAVATTTNSRSTFSNGGNLEELLNDIETISQDILKISSTTNNNNNNNNIDGDNSGANIKQEKPYKSELSVVLMPNPMPLIGFEKYKNLQKSFESLNSMTKSNENLNATNPFIFETNVDKNLGGGSKTNLLDLTSSDLISSENEENLRFQTTNNNNNNNNTKMSEKRNENIEETVAATKKTPKLSIRRKVSIHFKGNKKDGSSGASGGNSNNKRQSLFDLKFGAAANQLHQKTPSLESRKSTTDAEPKTPTSSDSKSGMDRRKSEKTGQSSLQGRKSASVSPERGKHVHVKDEKKQHKKHKKAGERMKIRRGTMGSVDRLHRERSYSICTDRSYFDNHRFFDEWERERTNSLSSCDTVKTRKMSNMSNIPLHGKVPWCACWGNGCL